MSCRRRRADCCRSLSRLLSSEQGASQTVARSEIRFTPARTARAIAAMSNTQLRRASDAAWSNSNTCVAHRGGRGQSFVYELLYDGGGDDDGAASVGPDRRGDTCRARCLRRASYRGEKPAVHGVIPAPKRGHSGGWPACVKIAETPDAATRFGANRRERRGNAYLGEQKTRPRRTRNGSSYTRARIFFFSCFFLSR